ncbi:MAG: imidazolonepropionase [Bacteroidetes bacterium]|nr:MAG: imidazolonepropionase [Bacteroidota bacterium]
MATTLIINIENLVNTRDESRLLSGQELAELPSLLNAYLLLEDNRIAEWGAMADLSAKKMRSTGNLVDATGQWVMPCWCDSHTHLVFAGSRENEFVDKLQGLSYGEINAKGGGILSTVAQVRESSEEKLFNLAWQRLESISRLGTGAVEIKSGYGLTVESEIKMLRVIRKLKSRSKLSIRSTFLGAHTYPALFKDDHAGYVRQIIEEMLPVIAKEGLADYIDVFCEKGFFNPEETEAIVRAGLRYGLKPKLHVNQLNSIGGVETGLRLNALSLDHLETLTDVDLRKLSDASIKKEWAGVCTLLPTAAFFLRMPFQPARQLIDRGCAVALASDYNPGSSPSGNMNFVVALSCIQMKMLPAEAINAATINGAYAMGLEKELGSITKGKKANLIFTNPMPSLAYFPYSFGTNLIARVMIDGEFV